MADTQVEDSQKMSDSEEEQNNIDIDTDKKGKKKNAAPPAPKIKPPAKKRAKVEQAEEKETKKEKEPVKEVKKSKKVEKEVEEDAESEAEENGDDEKVPLLDQPLELSGARERKQVERFIPKTEVREGTGKGVEIPEGKGTELGEIPRIQYELSKMQSDGLKSLHKVLFTKVGQSHTIKKNIQKFNGFEFDKSSSDYAKKLAVLTKLRNAELKNICTILDLTKTGKQAELAERVLLFLLEPVNSGRGAPAPRPKRRGVPAKSYQEPGVDDLEPKKGRGRGTKKKAADSDDEDDIESEDEKLSEDEAPPPKKAAAKGRKLAAKKPAKNQKAIASDEDATEESDEKRTEGEDNDDEGENDADISEEDEKPKKNAPKRAIPPKKKAAAAAAAEKKEAAAAPKKRGAPKKNAQKEQDESAESEEEEAKSQSDADDSEKEPAAKKSKTPPSDDEIKTFVKSIIESANLEEITMKTVCKQVYEHYPEFDLGYKKEFIKNTVKSLIAS